MKTMNELNNDETSSTSVNRWRGTTGTTLNNTTRPDKPIIIVFGLIGIGKTSFINQVTGSSRPTGNSDNYVPCTEDCYMQAGLVVDVEVIFVDTPGFGNPAHSNRGILLQILQWVFENIGTSRKVTAALYFQSITRKEGSSLDGGQRESLDCFVSFIWKDFSNNIGLVSTHWGVIEKSNASLTMKRLWKKRFGKRARRFRLYNDQKRSVQVLKDLLKVEPGFIQAQKDLVAGRTILEGLRTEAKANRRLDFVKNHWKTNLIVAAVAISGIAIGSYLNISFGAALTACTAQQARITAGQAVDGCQHGVE